MNRRSTLMSEDRTSDPILLMRLLYSEAFHGLTYATLAVSVSFDLTRSLFFSTETTPLSSESALTRASEGSTAYMYGRNPCLRMVMDFLSRVLPYSSMTGSSPSLV